VRHVGHSLADSWARARGQENTGEGEQGTFQIRGGTIHRRMMPAQCGDRDPQSRPGCGNKAMHATITGRAWTSQEALGPAGTKPGGSRSRAFQPMETELAGLAATADGAASEPR
jgi:hypothetical protein